MSRPRDNAPGQGRVIEGQTRNESPDCAADSLVKRESTAQARAALLGLMLHRLADGGWLLCYAAFGGPGHVRTLPSLQAVEGALCAFEHVRAEVLSLIESMGARR